MHSWFDATYLADVCAHLYLNASCVEHHDLFENSHIIWLPSTTECQCHRMFPFWQYLLVCMFCARLLPRCEQSWGDITTCAFVWRSHASTIGLHNMLTCNAAGHYKAPSVTEHHAVSTVHVYTWWLKKKNSFTKVVTLQEWPTLAIFRQGICSSLIDDIRWLERFTFHPVQDLLILTPTRVLWRAFRQTRIRPYIASLLYSICTDRNVPPIPDSNALSLLVVMIVLVACINLNPAPKSAIIRDLSSQMCDRHLF